MTCIIEIINDEIQKGDEATEPDLTNDIVDWLNENNISVSKEFDGFNKVSLIFECEEDAVAFKLRWM